MSCPVEYWIWLQRTLGAGFFADELIAYFGDARGVYEAGDREWIASGALTAGNIEKLSTFSPSQSFDAIKKCETNGWHIIPCDSPLYPKRLLRINAYPLVLYVWGDASVLDSELSIGMVGTRNCSDYGLGVAGALSGDLAKAGFTVVSGGAVGVDRACHEGALNAGGSTIAFLGCGLGYDYLKSNENMRKRISENGAVVSEFLPFTPASRTTFPIRNRLISGMSLGTVVVEAKEKSGSLITARYSADQGRPVFAVPGDVTNSNFFGTNKLIRKGAKAVFSAFDIISEFSYMYPELEKTLSFDEKITSVPPLNYSDRTDNKLKSKKISKNKDRNDGFTIYDLCAEKEKTGENKTDSSDAVLPDGVTAEAKKVYSYLKSEPVYADFISERSGMQVRDVLTALTELELYGVCFAHAGGRYSK